MEMLTFVDVNLFLAFLNAFLLSLLSRVLGLLSFPKLFFNIFSPIFLIRVARNLSVILVFSKDHVRLH